MTGSAPRLDPTEPPARGAVRLGSRNTEHGVGRKPEEPPRRRAGPGRAVRRRERVAIRLRGPTALAVEGGDRFERRRVLRRWRPFGHRWLPERERVRLGAGLGERDLQRSLAVRAVLAHKLVHAPVLEQAVPVLVDVHAM
jgi:hypothetical protein